MLLVSVCLGLSALPARAVELGAAVFRIDYPTIAPISRFDATPGDLGFAGAQLATEDNNTTGGFLGHSYETETVSAPPEEADAAFGKLLEAGHEIIVVLARGEDLLRLAEMAGPDRLVLNAGAREVALRSEECRANVLHIAPSEAMLADAVAQVEAHGYRTYFLDRRRRCLLPFSQLCPEIHSRPSSADYVYNYLFLPR